MGVPRRRLVGAFAAVVWAGSCGGEGRDTAVLGSGGASGADAGSSGGSAGSSAGSKAGAGAGGKGTAGTTSEAGADPGGAAGIDGGEGGAPALEPVTIATGQQSPTGIAVDAVNVYWANLDAGTVVKCPLSGCNGASPVVLASDIAAPRGIDVDADSIYWLSSPEPPEDGGAPMTRVFKCPKLGCNGADPTLLFEIPINNQAHDVVVSEGLLYYAAWPWFGSCPTGGCLQSGRIELGGRPVVSVATDSTFLYVSEFGFMQISRCDLPDCTNGVVLVPDVGVLGLAVDSSHVYFAVNDSYDPTTENAYIARCPLAGCGADLPEVIIADDVSPYAIAVDGERIYYTNIVHGTVVSRPK